MDKLPIRVLLQPGMNFIEKFIEERENVIIGLTNEINKAKLSLEWAKQQIELDKDNT